MEKEDPSGGWVYNRGVARGAGTEMLDDPVRTGFKVCSSVLVVLAVPGVLFAAAGQDSPQVAASSTLSWNYAIFAATVSLVKVVALVIGYLVVRLGCTTMMAGVKGNDAVEFSALGMKFKFKGVTPGLALAVAGVLMMGWAISRQHQFSEEIQKNVAEGVQTTSPGEQSRPVRKWPEN